MPRFSKDSSENLATAHMLLQLVMNEAIKYYDFSVIEGHRGEERQNKLFDEGLTEVQWPDGKHNTKPSHAVDVCPYLPDKDVWDLSDQEVEKQWYMMAGIILGVAGVFDVDIRWGGDWDSDGRHDDQKFNDLPHFELVLKNE